MTSELCATVLWLRFTDSPILSWKRRAVASGAESACERRGLEERWSSTRNVCPLGVSLDPQPQMRGTKKTWEQGSWGGGDSLRQSLLFPRPSRAGRGGHGRWLACCPEGPHLGTELRTVVHSATPTAAL